jgi:hypothetical protein
MNPISNEEFNHFMDTLMLEIGDWTHFNLEQEVIFEVNNT